MTTAAASAHLRRTHLETRPCESNIRGLATAFRSSGRPRLGMAATSGVRREFPGFDYVGKVGESRGKPVAMESGH